MRSHKTLHRKREVYLSKFCVVNLIFTIGLPNSLVLGKRGFDKLKIIKKAYLKTKIILQWTIVGIPLDLALLIAGVPIMFFTWAFSIIGLVFALTE